MIKSDDIIAFIVYLVVLLVLIIIYHSFKRTSVSRSHAMLAAAAIALGLLQSIVGLILTIFVIGVAIKYDKPYDFHRVFLITTGMILIYSGSLNAVLSRWIKQWQR